MPRKPESCVECGKVVRRGSGSAELIRCRECRRKTVVHGSARMYRTGCRCDECKRGNAARTLALYHRRKAQGRPLNRKMYDVTCERCGETVQRTYQSRYCSQACNGAAARKVHSTELVLVPVGGKCILPPRHPVTLFAQRLQAKRPRGPWAVIVSGDCTWCGDYFAAPTGSGVARYCSKRCGAQAGRARQGEFAVPPRFRYAIYARDNWTCQLCGDPVERKATGLWRATLDHIVPRSKGGSDEWENLRLCHAWCNSVRGDATYYPDNFFAKGA